MDLASLRIARKSGLPTKPRPNGPAHVDPRSIETLPGARRNSTPYIARRYGVGLALAAAIAELAGLGGRP